MLGAAGPPVKGIRAPGRRPAPRYARAIGGGGRREGEGWRQPLAACCPAVGARLSPVANLSASLPWLDERAGSATFVRDEPGFVLEAWDGGCIASSWSYVRVHLLRRHRRPAAWSDFLHAALAPCLVLHQRPGSSGRPRLALYRLRPGIEHTFRVAIVEREGDAAFRLVTAFAKQSIVNHHYAALFGGVVATCPGYALRRRDLHQYPGWVPVPERWSTAARDVPDGCCERDPGCASQPGSFPVGSGGE
jgi:hypothetical protein